MKRSEKMTIAALASFLLMSLPAFGSGHTWRINEMFSNPDGTIMFIELKECCGGANETALNNKVISNTTLGNSYTIIGNILPFPICNCTSSAHFLLATQGFADLPGAPIPDRIMPVYAGGFLNLAGDTLNYSVYDPHVHGAIPTDGIGSLQRDGSITVNSPTNLAGDTASVIARCKPADLNQSGGVNVTDLLLLLGSWGPCLTSCANDINFSGTVNVTDLLQMLSEWGDCPPS